MASNLPGIPLVNLIISILLLTFEIILQKTWLNFDFKWKFRNRKTKKVNKSWVKIIINLDIYSLIQVWKHQKL